MKVVSRYFYVMLIFSNINISALTIHEFFLEDFNKVSVPTEEVAYNLLKKSHISDDINYVVVPWDYYIQFKKLDEIMKINLKLKGGFCVCQHLDFRRILPILKKWGINVLFSPHADKKEIDGIKIVPFPHLPVNGVDPVDHKDVWYSFIGAAWTHKVRDAIFAMKHSQEAILIERKYWHFGDKLSMPKHEEEYKDVLSRSRFSLCPRGYGPGTFRFWESLQAGAIPVLISDALALPEHFDWKNTIIRIAEKDVLKIPEILARITDEQEIRMRENSLQAFQLFCKDENFIRIIEEYYKK